FFQGLIVCFVVLCRNQCSGEPTLCYSCDNVFQPALCLKTTVCSADEACYVERGLDNIGATKYYSGCLPQQDCPTEHGDHFPVEQCLRCCLGHLCNIRGCGSLALLTEEQLACSSCSGLSDPRDCRDTAICSVGQVCGTKAKSSGAGLVYDVGCFDQPMCADPNSKCCNSNGCNYDQNLAIPQIPPSSTTVMPISTSAKAVLTTVAAGMMTSTGKTQTTRTTIAPGKPTTMSSGGSTTPRKVTTGKITTLPGSTTPTKTTINTTPLVSTIPAKITTPGRFTTGKLTTAPGRLTTTTTIPGIITTI
ncbi:hypothetical protein EGW08_006607, partial [Elysia chlorotica]